MQYSITGVVIGKRDISDTDRLYSFYSHELGMVTAVGRGTRKSTSKLAGQLETFNRGQIFIARSRGLGTITGALTEEYYFQIKKSEPKMMAALEIIKHFSKIVREGEKDENLVELLEAFLRTLNNVEENKVKVVKIGFLLKFLHLLGLGFEVSLCTVCGQDILSQKGFFNFESGGVVCSECATASNKAISDNAIKFVRLAYGNNMGSLSKISMDNKIAIELDNLVKRWIEYNF